MSSLLGVFLIAFTALALKAEAKISEPKVFNCESYEPNCEDPVRGDNDATDNPGDQRDETDSGPDGDEGAGGL